MTTSNRQEALRKIWETAGADELITVVGQDQELRRPELIDELDKEAAELKHYDVISAQKLRNMAQTLRDIHTLVKFLADVTDLTSLHSVYKSSPIAWHPEFPLLVEGFIQDAAASGDLILIERLRGGMALRNEVRQALEIVMGPIEPDQLQTAFKENSIVREPVFHDILQARMRLGQLKAEGGMGVFADRIERLRWLRRFEDAFAGVRDAQEDQGQQKDKDSAVQVRVPKPAWMADYWFLAAVGPAYDRVKEIAKAVSESRKETADAVIEVNEVLGFSKAAEVPLFTWSLLAEFLSRSATVEGIKKGLHVYRDKIGSPEWERSNWEIKTTFVLRFATAANRRWRVFSERQPLLKEVDDFISHVLPEVSKETSPRLLRDLLFERARVRENLGFWDPFQLTSSRTDYEAGLAVRAVAHEVAARTRALGDLANVWLLLPDVPRDIREERAEKLFKEALGLTSGEIYPTCRANICSQKVNGGLDPFLTPFQRFNKGGDAMCPPEPIGGLLILVGRRV